MKFLIAGFGSIGRRHFRNLKALGQEDILFLRSGQSQLADDELDGYPVETDIEAALAHSPDAVIVSNPTSKHLDIAIPAAKADCDLLLEKPLSNSLERVAELKKEVEQSKTNVLMGFQFRFHPGLLQAKQLLNSGDLGRPIAVRVHWGEYLPDWHPWEDFRKAYSARKDLGGGVVLTLSHPFDYLRWLLGEINSVWAIVRNSGELDIGVEDLAHVSLDFDNKAVGSVQLDYLQKPSAHWFEIQCAQGSLAWDATTGALKVFRNEVGELEEFPPPKGFERNDLFLVQMRHFIQVVEGKQQSLCGLEDGIRALEIALAALRSSEEGKRIAL